MINSAKRRRLAYTFFVVLLVLLPSPLAVPLASGPSQSSATANIDLDSKNSQHLLSPIVHRDRRVDEDSNGIQDSLESLIHEVGEDGESVPVVVTLYEPVSDRVLELFTQLGGQVSCVYTHVTYGFAGSIPAVAVSILAEGLREKLVVIESDWPLRYHLDVSVPLILARPVVWETYGYLGSANQSLAVLDTGVDDTHVDVGPYQDLNFSNKMVGWFDATSDGSLTPEDYGEHGTHVSAIAVGTGASNSLQGAGPIETTFTYVLPDIGYGYVDFLDVANPGTIQLVCRWSGTNAVLLRLYNPGGTIVDEVLGANSPLTIEYDTDGTSYPTGSYMVLVGNYLGPAGSPFSCVETYPYEGVGDGYNLFSGVAPNSRLVGVKVFDNAGYGVMSTLLGAMDWIIANRHAYHIVVATMSLSLEYGSVDSTLDQKVDTMVQNGIVSVASAGNDYPTYTIGSPGTAAYTITVAATNDQNGITGYSSNGDQVKNEYGLVKPDVAAPGGTFDTDYGSLIISADSNDVDGAYSGFPDQNGNDYQQMGGTSMAAPHVAGLAMLVVQALNSWNWTLEEALKVKMLISMTASETNSGEGSNVPTLDRGGKDEVEGYGLVNADAAIEAATLSYSVGDEENSTFGSNPASKRVWARQLFLLDNSTYTFNLSTPVDADYDLYLYNGTGDSYGQPTILAKSTSASLGANETVHFTPNSSSTHYLVVKRVSGQGMFSLSSAAGPIRDLAVTQVTVSSSAIYEGESIDINITVWNYGNMPENFSVTAFYNTTAIETKNVTNLSPSENTTLTFNWDTSGVQPCHNYTIRAEASLIPSETNTLNNIYVDGTVKIKMQGDINGDGAVDIFDLSKVGVAYGTFEGTPGYDAEADINQDGVVDARDLAIVSWNYGNTC